MKTALLLAALLAPPAWGAPEPPFCERGMDMAAAGCNDLTNQEWCRKRGALTSRECFVYRTYGPEKMKEMRAASAAKAREITVEPSKEYIEALKKEAIRRNEEWIEKCSKEGALTPAQCATHRMSGPPAAKERRAASASGTADLWNTVLALGLLAVFAVGLGAALVYVLPSIIAWARKHPNARLITILNLLLGWTAIVWLVLLIWAFINPIEPTAVIVKDKS